MDKVIEQLKGLKNVRPDRDWVATRRALLLSQISGQSAPQKESILANGWYFVKSLLPTGMLKFMARPIGVVSAMLVVIFGSGIFGVSASRDSLPGDLLYPVKLTGEKVKVSLSNNREQAKLHTEFAAERVKEIEKVVADDKNSDEQKKAKIIVAVNGLESEMKQAQEKLDISKNDIKDKAVVEVAKQVDAKTGEITDLINKNKASSRKMWKC